MSKALTIPAAIEVRVPGALAARVVLRDGRRCVYCCDNPSGLSIDHVRPQAHFHAEALVSRVNAPRNLVAACADCNGAKGIQDLGGFARMLRGRGVATDDVRAMIARVRAAVRRPLP